MAGTTPSPTSSPVVNTTLSGIPGGDQCDRYSFAQTLLALVGGILFGVVTYFLAQMAFTCLSRIKQIENYHASISSFHSFVLTFRYRVFTWGVSSLSALLMISSITALSFREEEEGNSDLDTILAIGNFISGAVTALLLFPTSVGEQTCAGRFCSSICSCFCCCPNTWWDTAQLEKTLSPFLHNFGGFAFLYFNPGLNFVVYAIFLRRSGQGTLTNSSIVLVFGLALICVAIFSVIKFIRSPYKGKCVIWPPPCCRSPHETYCCEINYKPYCFRCDCCVCCGVNQATRRVTVWECEDDKRDGFVKVNDNLVLREFDAEIYRLERDHLEVVIGNLTPKQRKEKKKEYFRKQLDDLEGIGVEGKVENDEEKGGVTDPRQLDTPDKKVGNNDGNVENNAEMCCGCVSAITEWCSFCCKHTGDCLTRYDPCKCFKFYLWKCNACQKCSVWCEGCCKVKSDCCWYQKEENKVEYSKPTLTESEFEELDKKIKELDKKTKELDKKTEELDKKTKELAKEKKEEYGKEQTRRHQHRAKKCLNILSFVTEYLAVVLVAFGNFLMSFERFSLTRNDC